MIFIWSADSDSIFFPAFCLNSFIIGIFYPKFLAIRQPDCFDAKSHEVKFGDFYDSNLELAA